MAAGEQRAAALAQQCAADEAAELEPASAAVSAALGVLSRGGEASGEALGCLQVFLPWRQQQVLVFCIPVKAANHHIPGLQSESKIAM